MPIQQRSEETRARIRATAARLFSHNGYEATGVAEICSAAGVSKGAFYHHFPTKQALFLAILNEWLENLNQTLSAALTAGGNVPRGLEEMAGQARGIFQAASGQLPMFLEFWTQSTRDPLVWQATIAPYHQYAGLFAGILRQGVAEGSLKAVDPEVAARVLVGLAVGVLLQGLLDPQGAAWDQVLRSGVEMLMKGVENEPQIFTDEPR